jgi:GNAT superfamily N-acetyltransferase
MPDVSSQDLDLITRTVLGEAAREGEQGQLAVAHVIKNRIENGRYGSTPQEVLFRPKQFEPWTTRKGELMAIDPGSPAYQNARRLVVSAFAGEAADPTNGATHFANVKTVEDRGNTSALGWINGMSNVSKIGNHTFGNADAGSTGSTAPSSPARISYADMEVPQVPATVKDALAAEQLRFAHREATAPTLWQGVKDAASTETILGNVLNNTPLGAVAIPDPDFRWNPDAFKEATKGVPKEYWGTLADARSDAHAKWLRERIDDTVRAQQNLSDLGWTGTALSTAAMLLDPASIGLAVATEGGSAALMAAGKAARAASVPVRAAAGAAAGASVVAAEHATNLREDHASDYLLGAGLGAGLAGTLAHLHRGLDPQLAGKIIGAGQRMETEASIPALEAGGVGAQRLKIEAPFLNDDAVGGMHNSDTPETLLAKGRFDASAAIDKTGVPLARALGAGLLEDSVGKKGGAVNAFAAELEMRKFYQVEAGKITRAAKSLYDEWADAHGLSWWEKKTSYGRFTDEVGTYRRNPDLYPEAPESVRKMNAELTRFFNDRLDHQQRVFRDTPGIEGRAVAGADNVPVNERYLPRVDDVRKVKIAVERFGTETVEELWAGAIRSAQPDLEEDLIRRMAKGRVSRSLKNTYGLKEDPKFTFMGNDIEALRSVLRSEYDLSEADIANVVARMPKRDGTGTDAHLKFRIDADEGFVLRNISDRFGRPAEQLKLTDLLVNDAIQLADHYNRRTAGRVALARVRIKDPITGDLIVNGITKDSEFETLIQKMKQQAADMVREGRTVDPVTAETNLRFAFQAILGRPMYGHEGSLAEFSRWVRKYNYARLMNQMGFAQAAEAANIAGQAGLRAMFQQLPSLKRIKNMDGHLVRKHGLEEELETIFGLGSEELRHDRFHRWDEFGSDFRHPKSELAHKAENVLDTAGRVTSHLSGFSFVNEMTQMWAARAAAQKFANLAANPSAANLRRMASLGLDTEKKPFKIPARPNAPPPVKATLELDRKYLLKHVYDTESGNGAGISFGEGMAKDLGVAPNGDKAITYGGNIYVVRPSPNGFGDSVIATVKTTERGGVRRVEHVAVAPSEQGKGLGKWLLKTAKKEMPGLDLTTSFDGEFSKAGASLFNSFNRASPTTGEASMLDRVLSEIKAHSTIEPGALFGGKLKKLNMDAWTDHEARSSFENSLFRWSRRMIQENDYGSMAHWMSHPMAQLMLQFRTFVANAWAKQLVHNVAMGDFQSFTTFAYALMAGAAVYSVQEQLKAVGRDDRDTVLKKRLAPEQILQAAIQRAGPSSFLPDIAATVARPFGFQLFNTHASGKPGDVWFGNPATGLYNDVTDAIKGLAGPTIDGRSRTKKDTQDAIRPLIWQNALPVTVLMNYLTSGMPERPPKTR